jgi:hypothetical protein
MMAARGIGCVLSLLAASACAQTGGPDAPVSDTNAAAAPSAMDEGVTGSVVTASGQPVAGALIQVSAAGAASGPIPDIAVLSDAEGNFVWRLQPGSYRVAALVNGREIAGAEVTVSAGRVTTLRLQTR